MARAVADSAPFLFHLTAVLALVLLALSLGRLLRRRELFPQPTAARVAVSTIGFAFCAVATLVVLIGQVPRGLVLPLEGGFGFLSLLVAGAFVRARMAARAKVAVVLFALPGIFHVASQHGARATGDGHTGVRGSGIYSPGEASLILAAATAPFTLAPRRSAGRITPGRRSRSRSPPFSPRRSASRSRLATR